jgi:XTP/dITP diphosphohydrolase
MKTIYFVTANSKKIEESEFRFQRFAERSKEKGVTLKFEICPFKKHLDELLDPDVKKIVERKALEAYRIFLQPCVVEHGGLFLDAWKTSQEKPGLLGGIGQVVWDSVGQMMCGFLRKEDTRAASAQSVVGYCDGRRIYVYSGITLGELTCEERGVAGLRWDPIFKPTGSDLTYGEMTPEQKRETSPEEIAWEHFFTAVMNESSQS